MAINPAITIYISASSPVAASAACDRIRSAGFAVLSDWHEPGPHPEKDAVRNLAAEHNLSIINEVDALVLIADGVDCKGGKFFEAGHALAAEKIVINVGKRENILMHANGIRVVPDIDGAIEILEEWRDLVRDPGWESEVFGDEEGDEDDGEVEDD